MLLCELNKLLVLDTTSSNKNHSVASVVCLDVVLQVIPGDRLNVLGWAENGATKWLALESSCVQVIKDNLLQLLVDLLGLSKNDIALAVDGRLFELGVGQDVGKNVDGLGNVGIECFGVVYCVFALLIVSNVRDPDLVDVRKCRRSSVHPCSRSRALTAVASCCWFPAHYQYSPR